MPTTTSNISTRTRRRLRRPPRPAPYMEAGDAAKLFPTEGGAAFHARRADRPRQGGAARAAALGARRLGSSADTHRSRRSPRGAGADPPARAGRDPVRAHARVAVHLLPRRRLLDG